MRNMLAKNFYVYSWKMMRNMLAKNFSAGKVYSWTIIHFVGF
jgi:hypothetical protein